MNASANLGWFIALSVLMAVVLALIAIMPWLRAKKEAIAVDNRLLDINIDVYRSRLLELAGDKEAGTISASHYQAQKTELERQLLAAEQITTPMQTPGSKGKLLLILWMPIFVGLAYVAISDRTSVYTLWHEQQIVGQVADDLLTGKIDEPPEWALRQGLALFSAMQTNVHFNADDPARWLRLAEIFLSFEATDSGLEALSRAHRLAPEDEDIAMMYAQTSFFAQDGFLDDNIRRIVEETLRNNPNQQEAQMLMALGEARRGNYTQAQSWIDRMRSTIGQKSGDRSHELSGLESLAADIAEQKAQAMEGFDISVTINPSLLPLVTADDVLFVAIRSIEGGAPYAAKRLPISNLSQGKITLTLNNMDMMTPERTLQSAQAAGERLVVTARVSHSGNATTQSGDLSANPVIVNNEQQQINIEINQQMP
ncbi:c-type cytochrome biogenesis protein CcmI [Psychrobacter jeotgali]|uniref:c-type cytochrome biogenesis protein CcmI n=1 Tax=Psychrobacter jeotgali TaxID=179010 RepID=UPI00191875D9|nr:c-type cytochrome biogenesis protein CcmI [Psychrobacter jeotgali]